MEANIWWVSCFLTEEVAQAFEGENIDEETPEDEREEEEEEVVDEAIGGAESPSGTFETQSSSSQEGTGGFEDRREDLLRELQREIEKLKLFNIKGWFACTHTSYKVYVVENTCTCVYKAF